MEDTQNTSYTRKEGRDGGREKRTERGREKNTDLYCFLISWLINSLKYDKGQKWYSYYFPALQRLFTTLKWKSQNVETDMASFKFLPHSSWKYLHKWWKRDRGREKIKKRKNRLRKKKKRLDDSHGEETVAKGIHLECNLVYNMPWVLCQRGAM